MSQPYSAKRKFGRVLTAFSAVLGATILACILLWPRQRLLLREARQLPLTANNFFSREDRFAASAWRSNHEQLLLKRASSANHDIVSVRDVNTNIETLLQPFNDRFAVQLKFAFVPSVQRGAVGGKPVNYTVPQTQFSLDGKWLLWQQAQTWRAFALDGSAQRQWPRAPQENRYRRTVLWSSDNRIWLEPRYDTQFRINGAQLHSLEDSVPDEIRTFADSAGHWPLGTTSERHLLTHDYDFNTVSAYTLYDTDLKTNHALTRKIRVSLPAKAMCMGVSLSPEGTRLLWSLQTRQELPGPRPIQSFLGRLGFHAQLQQSLWVSNADGSDLREVGHFNIPSTPAPLPGARNARFLVTNQLVTRLKGVHSVHWLADSKHAMFVCGDNVYEVAIE